VDTINSNSNGFMILGWLTEKELCRARVMDRCQEQRTSWGWMLNAAMHCPAVAVDPFPWPALE